MEALTEFHPYPRLPREVQNMIWGFYSKSLPVLRHNFHLHRAQNGDESCHYILYNEETKFFVQTQFRCEQDELSLVQYVFPASLICSLGIFPSSQFHMLLNTPQTLHQPIESLLH